MPPRYLPLPGSGFGPCFFDCTHRECNELRAIAASECRHCGRRISFDVRYISDQLGNVHASCDQAIQELANPDRPRLAWNDPNRPRLAVVR